MPDLSPLSVLGAAATDVAAAPAPVKAGGLGSLLQHQRHVQQQQEQQAAMAAAAGVMPVDEAAMSDTTDSDNAAQQQQQQQQQQRSCTMESSVAHPAGPLARSLNVSMFSSPSGGGVMSPHKHGVDGAAASAGGSGGYATPSKRSKHASPSAQSMLMPSNLLVSALPPSAGMSDAAGGVGEGVVPVSTSPSRSLSQQQAAASMMDSPPLQQTSMMILQQGRGHSPPTDSLLAPGSGSKSSSAQHQQAGGNGGGSLSKRRNSGTASLHLSPAYGPTSPAAIAQAQAQQGSSSARKPPAYPQGNPSTPSTPSMTGRSLPINIGSGSGNGSGRRSSAIGGGNGVAGSSPASSAHSTPPATPPMQPLPVPRAMLPQSPLTPALGPERTIPITTPGGHVQRVSSQQLGKYVAQELSLPPQAAPDVPYGAYQQQHHHHHHGRDHGHHGHHHRHGHHQHQQHQHQQQQQQQQQQHQQQQHAKPPRGGAEAAKPAAQVPAASAATAPSTTATSTQARSPQSAHPLDEGRGASPPATPQAHSAPASAPPFVHLTPVKHLVKLSSLSSLSSLIAPSHNNHNGANGHNQDPAGSPPYGGANSPMSPASASSPSASASPPTSSPVSPLSGSLSAHPLSSLPRPVLLPAPTALAPTYIILDIDETIHINAYTHPVFGGCSMMQERGLDMYQKIISSHVRYRTVSYAAKSALTKTLQAALQSKRTVEHGTADLLNALQAANAAGGNNIRIFGLTARYSHMAQTTRKELLKLGIDLEKSSPFPMGVRKRMAAAAKGTSPQQSPSPADRSLTPSPILSSASVGSSPALGPMSLPGSAAGAGAAAQPYVPDVTWVDHPSFGTDACYRSGVIYTNATDKGPVLSRFLEFLWQSIEEDNHDVLAQNAANVAAYERAVQAHAIAVAQANAAQLQRKQPPSSSPSLDDLAGQLASSSTGAAASQQSSDSNANPSPQAMMSHAVSNPIPIQSAMSTGLGAAAAAAAAQHMAPQSTPSPPDGHLSLLHAAGQVAQRKGAANGGSGGGARRISRTSDHLLPPSERDGLPPLSPVTGGSSGGECPWAATPFQLLPLSLLPTRLIFIDDRLQNCFSVYESLSSAPLFDAYYNHAAKRKTLNHVPTALEVYTCHYVPKELQHTQPTNQTKADAAASAAAAAAHQAAADAQPDLELIEAQIHHFLTHGEILNDAKGRAILAKLREEQGALKRRVAEVEAEAKALKEAAAKEKAQSANSASVESAASSASAASSGSSNMSDVSSGVICSDLPSPATAVVAAAAAAGATVSVVAVDAQQADTSMTPRNHAGRE